MQEQLVLKSYGGVTPQEDFVVTYPCWVLVEYYVGWNVKTGLLSVWKRNHVYSEMECWWWFAECRFHPRTISIQDQFLFEVLVDSNHVSECYQTVDTCIRKLVLYLCGFCSYSTE